MKSLIPIRCEGELLKGDLLAVLWLMFERNWYYSINLDIKFDPLQLIDIQTLVDECDEEWYNQTLTKVNDCVVRLGIMQGEFHWHKHDEEDEFFYVIDGKFIIDLEGRSVELNPKQGFTVLKGVVHKTRAPERTVILMVEGSGVMPTGD